MSKIPDRINIDKSEKRQTQEQGGHCSYDPVFVQGDLIQDPAGQLVFGKKHIHQPSSGARNEIIWISAS